jgi:hypothetical protein
VDRPLPWLRYIDADDLDNDAFDFDGLKVRNDAHETLGKVDGFIVDSASARPYYVVVDSGGWFKSKHFLVPIGHVRLDDDRDALVADLPKERINRFPGFDKDEFEKFSEGDIKRMNDSICVATNVTAVTYAADEPYSAAWDRPQYRQPDWWNTTPSLPTRMGDRAFTAGVEYPPSKIAPTSSMSNAGSSSTVRSSNADRNTKENRVVAHEAEPSPHFDGRAQPGDVLGVETGGEQTHIGETTDEENKRRRDAERAATKRRD